MNGEPIHDDESLKGSPKKARSRNSARDFSDFNAAAGDLLRGACVYTALNAFLKVSTDGTFASLPDSSMNILQEKPTAPCG
jgi:hypothetical protein